jgi:hypothetical protein
MLSENKISLIKFIKQEPLTDDIYFECAGIFVDNNDLHALKFLHEQKTLELIMKLNVEVFEESRKKYYDLVNKYGKEDDWCYKKIILYDVKAPNTPDQLALLKQSKVNQFRKYLEHIAISDNDMFTWIYLQS